MATAKKLPSGSWRCRVYSHTEQIPQPDGSIKKKRIYESFTSTDKTRAGKREAELMADMWLADRKERLQNVTINDAVALYLDAREGVLSPSTMRSYRIYARTHFGPISALPVRQTDKVELQRWVSNLAAKYAPKTVRNVYGLLNSACMELTGASLDLTMPAHRDPELHTPTQAEVSNLLARLKGTDLEIAVVLSAICSLRRGEICALDAEDLHGDVLTVSKSIVRDPDGLWVVKQPKTRTSYRQVIVPDVVVPFFEGKTGRVFDMTPGALTKRFERAVTAAAKAGDCAVFRFHDLRHYYASIAHALGIPDVYIMQQGGWQSDHVMKRVYRDALPDRLRAEAEKLVSHADDLIS